MIGPIAAIAIYLAFLAAVFTGAAFAAPFWLVVMAGYAVRVGWQWATKAKEVEHVD